MIGESTASALVQKALDGTWQRQKVIANNIANHETPGYKAGKVSFEQSLINQVKHLQASSVYKSDTAQNIESINNSKILIHTDHSIAERADGNSVNLESENIQMAKTQIQYQFLTRTLTDYYSRLRYAISEGKR